LTLHLGLANVIGLAIIVVGVVLLVTVGRRLRQG
jgi:hypothetical protein